MGSDPSQQILNLTLRVLYMLFGEDFIIMKKFGGRLAVRKSSAGAEAQGWSQSPTTEPEKNDNKILKVIKKIIELLTGEVPKRCHDVAVYLSTEEREYLEEHKELYENMMDDLPPLTFPAMETDESPIFQGNSTEEEDEIVITAQSAKCWSTDDQVMVNYLKDFLKVSALYEEDLEPPVEKNPPVNPINDWPVLSEDMRRIILRSVLSDHSYSRMVKSLLYKEVFQPDPTPAPMTGIKEEHLSQGDGNHQTSDTSTNIEYRVVRITEDFYPCSEEHAPPIAASMPDDFQQYVALSIKKEPTAYEETTPCTFSSPTPVQVKEEPSSYKVEVPAEIELFADGTLCLRNVEKSKPICRAEDHPLTCKICFKRFKQKSGLGRHVKIHAKEETHTCPDCGRCFMSQTSLWEHQKIHSEAKPYSCPECGKGFSKLSNLTNHQRIHATKNPFSCVECGKQFVSNNNLRRHQRKHSEEVLSSEEFYCLECGKTFTDRQTFRKHQRYHAGDNPYPCTECGRRFIKRINLIKHMRFHTRKNLHSCQECGKFFMSSAYLVRHMNSHTKKRRPCSCPVCGKYFLSNKDLIVHQRVHKAEKPGSTSEWRSSFIQKLGVVIQERNNVDEKPYSCPDCGMFFERKLQLYRHQKTHNKEIS